MRLHKCFHLGVIIAVSAGLLAAGPLQAAPPASPAPVKPIDVELQAGGGMAGRLIDGHGQGVPLARIVLHSGATVIAETQSDPAGNFRFDAVRGGVYHLSTSGSTSTYRLWANHTAPPGAVSGPLVVSTENVVAGQYSPMKYWLADPLVIGGIIAVGAGVPIILANQNNDHGS